MYTLVYIYICVCVFKTRLLVGTVGGTLVVAEALGLQASRKPSGIAHFAVYIGLVRTLVTVFFKKRKRKRKKESVSVTASRILG